MVFSAEHHRMHYSTWSLLALFLYTDEGRLQGREEKWTQTNSFKTTHSLPTQPVRVIIIYHQIYTHSHKERGSRWAHWRALFRQGLTGYSVHSSHSTVYRLCFTENYKGDSVFCQLSLNGTDSTGPQLRGCWGMYVSAAHIAIVNTHMHKYKILMPKAKHVSAECNKSSSYSCVHLSTSLLMPLLLYLPPCVHMCGMVRWKDLLYNIFHIPAPVSKSIWYYVPWAERKLVSGNYPLH